MALHSISICTGIGGLDLAVEIACPGAFRSVLYCEREASAAEIIAARIEEGSLPAAPIWSDVKTVCCRRVRDYVRAATRGEGIGLLTAGYPCQPFSVAGKRRGKDDPRHIWPFIVDAIDCYRPAICFFENVAGNLRLGFGVVRRNLRERGYSVQAIMASASEVGAPHQRLRLFILAVDDGDDIEGPIHARQRGREPGAADSGGSGGEASEREWPPWPPARNDADRWRAVLARCPELAPAIPQTQPDVRRMAHGPASWNDRLRMLGNAVIPLTAAAAFVQLLTRHHASMNGVSQ